MTAVEFRLWLQVLQECPVDSDGDSPEADLAWSAIQAKVEALSREPDEHVSIGTGVMWGAFWLALGAVLTALAWRLA